MSQGTCPATLAGVGITDTPTFQAAVDSVADLLGTGGSAVADFGSLSVTYTAGGNNGTDSLSLPSTVRRSSLSRKSFLKAGSNRFPGGYNTYQMTVSPSQALWLQQESRAEIDSRAVGWYPSWAEWPNNHTGGFVCVRWVL